MSASERKAFSTIGQDVAMPPEQAANGSSTLYARSGEDIVCDAGHVVTRPTQDLRVMEVVHGYMLEGFAHLSSGDASRGIPGDAFPPCACGAGWFWAGAMQFRDGYRAVVDGVVVSMTLEQVSADWRQSARAVKADRASGQVRS